MTTTEMFSNSKVVSQNNDDWNDFSQKLNQTVILASHDWMKVILFILQKEGLKYKQITVFTGKVTQLHTLMFINIVTLTYKISF